MSINNAKHLLDCEEFSPAIAQDPAHAGVGWWRRALCMELSESGVRGRCEKPKGQTDCSGKVLLFITWAHMPRISPASVTPRGFLELAGPLLHNSQAFISMVKIRVEC
ncbi:hypothetical protein JZ751_007929 [Albula glossodonta]|uniref:Uncharacterized protein n=1 Tax=Albula glossodonta TaxID=121402 RepID=A0A8T2P4B4_9TELE|nr:hypothetical protein JZ751_007929 [Albula glossodonta]